MLLKDRVAVITGIGPGMGREIALLFARNGARLAIGARSEGFLKKVERDIAAEGYDVIAVKTDLADPASCEAIVQTAIRHYGGVDILVQNGHDTGDMSLIENADSERWRATFDCNLFGALNLFRACLPSMRARGDGRVILINSGAANNRPPEYLASYAASKAALASLVRSIALENGKDGIRCNGVHLGPVDGENFRPWLAEQAQQKGVPFEKYFNDYLEAEFPLRYVPSPAECAGTVLYLASDLARVVTGQALSVNGGQWFAK
jgi:NAD(P)-dependent dehydrogenase (short-subunit alcohol dehydrogenase family)